MALKEYLGAIILEIDGTEYEVESVDVDHKPNRNMVKTMNRKGKPSGFSEGVHEWSLKVVAPIPVTAAPDWDAIKGGKLTIFPVTSSGSRVSYLDCVSMGDSKSFTVGSEAKVTVTLAACDEIKE
jgi:hypothetical protein